MSLLKSHTRPRIPGRGSRWRGREGRKDRARVGDTRHQSHTEVPRAASGCWFRRKSNITRTPWFHLKVGLKLMVLVLGDSQQLWLTASVSAGDSSSRAAPGGCLLRASCTLRPEKSHECRASPLCPPTLEGLSLCQI